MEHALALLVGFLIAVSVFLMLSRNLVRILFGVAILSNGVNLLLLTAGRITRITPPLIPEGQYVLEPSAANPLPQALILTAIVISFALFAFILVLVRCVCATTEHDDVTKMRSCELPDTADGAPETLADGDKLYSMDADDAAMIGAGAQAGQRTANG